MTVAGYRVLSVWTITSYKKLLEKPVVVKVGYYRIVKRLLNDKYFNRVTIKYEPYYRFENLNEPLTEDDFI